MRNVFLLVTLIASNALAQPEPNPARECQKALATETRFAAVVKKIPIEDISKITFQMLADEKFPSPAERTAIAAWVDADKACFEAGIEWRRKNFPPQIIALATETNTNFYLIVVDLYNKKITYGAFNRRAQQAFNEFQSKFAVIVQQLQDQAAGQKEVREAREKSLAAQRERDAEQQSMQQRDAEARRVAEERARREAYAARQAQQEEADRQMAIQYLLNNRTPQAAPYQLPLPRSPITTNCQQIGGQWRCTTN